MRNEQLSRTDPNGTRDIERAVDQIAIADDNTIAVMYNGGTPRSTYGKTWRSGSVINSGSFPISVNPPSPPSPPSPPTDKYYQTYYWAEASAISGSGLIAGVFVEQTSFHEVNGDLIWSSSDSFQEFDWLIGASNPKPAKYPPTIQQEWAELGTNIWGLTNEGLTYGGKIVDDPRSEFWLVGGNKYPDFGTPPRPTPLPARPKFIPAFGGGTVVSGTLETSTSSGELESAAIVSGYNGAPQPVLRYGDRPGVAAVNSYSNGSGVAAARILLYVNPDPPLQPGQTLPPRTVSDGSLGRLIEGGVVTMLNDLVPPAHRDDVIFDWQSHDLWLTGGKPVITSAGDILVGGWVRSIEPGGSNRRANLIIDRINHTLKEAIFPPGTSITPDGRGFNAQFVAVGGFTRPGTTFGDSGILLPVTMRITDRDDPKKKWTDNVVKTAPAYSGKFTGDMVSWKLDDTDSWADTTFSWWAEGPETRSGPSGVGKNEWRIADGDADIQHDWIDWKPGTYKIKCMFTLPSGASSTGEFEQEVGVRTDDILVIGQIVPTHTHDADAPPLIAVGNYPWQITSPVALFRRAVNYDIAGWFTVLGYGRTADAVREALAVTPLPITAKLSEAHFVYWSLVPHQLTPTGPFASSWPLGNGNVQYGHRYWMVQHMLNVSPDFPVAPAQIPASTLDATRAAKQFRIMHRYQNKFFVDADGKILPDTVKKLYQIADEGKTKINFGVEAGELNPLWNNPEWKVDLTTEPPETNQYHGKEQTSADRTKVSSFATARIGAKGRNVNWRLFGKDAPWIYPEIIFEVKPDRTVEMTVKASVDITWRNGAVVQGNRQFNNLNIYKLQRNLETDQFEFVRQGDVLSMEGKLEPFINSATGQWPEPPIPPSVQ